MQGTRSARVVYLQAGKQSSSMGKHKKLAVVLGIAVISCLAILGYIRSPHAQKRAIDSAVKWQQTADAPLDCSAVLTPAEHTLTGAKYTFNDGCLPPGWEQGIDNL